MANNNLKTYELQDITYYKTYGRYATENQVPFPLFSNGYGIEVLVTGSELWIDVEVDYNVFEPWIFTEIDGAFMSRQMLNPGSQSICLFRRENFDRKKKVRFFRELQAMADDPDCKLLIKGFKTDGDFFPVPDKKYKLEFLGDSITSGEGTYGIIDEAEWLPMYMSYSNDYAKMIADRMDADFHILSNGGYGVFTGWNNDFSHNIPAFYEKVCGILTGDTNKELGALEDYDFSWQADAIIINLGANDNISFYNPPFTDPITGETTQMRLNEDGSFNTEDLKKITDAVINLLKMLRKHNPNTHLIWTFGMLESENDLGSSIRKAVNEYKSTYKDENAAYLELPATKEGEFGSRWHPGVGMHRKAADLIVEHLKNL